MEKEMKFSGNIYDVFIEKDDIIDFFSDLVESGLSHRIAEVDGETIKIEIATYSASDEEDFEEILSDWIEYEEEE